jgi:acyl-CoA dehydrogenase
MATFEATRPAVGAQALGIARAAYEYSLDYAKERKQFGRAIIENQGIAFKLADMKMHIDAARLLVWRASWMAATRKPFLNGEGSMSKLYAGETAVKVTERRSRSSVATATCASTRSSAGTATRRSTRFLKEPARFSA